MTKVAGLASNRGRNLRHIDDRRPGGAELAVVLANHGGRIVDLSYGPRGEHLLAWYDGSGTLATLYLIEP